MNGSTTASTPEGGLDSRIDTSDASEPAAGPKTAPASSGAGATAGQRRFRGDVEGLRAVAVTLVLLYHAGLAFIPGGYVGVDVFFVISGFLITTLLVSELRRTGTISLARFYARRAKRLLPAAAVVLATTFILVRLFVPATRWQTIGGDIVSAALYVVNWRLAGRSVDYLAEDVAPSPVQHFWSLAVEEQYYVVWPLLILLAAVVAKALRRRSTAVLWAGLAVIVVPSFLWSLAETAYSPARAFFETTTRMWELGIGAAVALGAAFWPRIRRAAAIVIGWVGFLAVVASGLIFTTDTQWPGFAAVAPTLGTAGVIVAGFAVGRPGPATVLDTQPFRWVGALSYSLYLWHWPLLVVAAAYFGDLAPWQGLTVAVCSSVPAWLTFRLVENPIRHSAVLARSARFALSLGANFTLAGVTVGLALVLAADATGAASASRGTALGAAILRDHPRDDPAGSPADDVGWMTPAPAEATKDVPIEYAEGCQQVIAKAEVVECLAGDTNGATLTVAVVGDSKATQWLPALRTIGQQNQWKIVTYLKSSCAFSKSTPQADGKPYEACQTWNRRVDNLLDKTRPDYVITTQAASTALDRDGTPSKQAMVAGLRRGWTDLTARGTKVVVIADNPSPGINVYECAARNPARLSACSFDRTRYETSSAAPVQHAAVRGLDGVTIVDLFDSICPTARCAPVIGNVLLYRQGSHLTRTYVQSLTPRLAAALVNVGLPATYRQGG